MNICILTFDYLPRPVYGSGVYVDFLTKLIRSEGHIVKVVTVNRFGLINDEEVIYCDCIDIQEATCQGKCICTFGNMGCFKGLIEEIVRRFEQNDFIPEIIYVNGYMYFEIALKLKEIYQGSKIVSAIHYLAEQDAADPNDEEWRKIYCEETRMVVFSDQIIYFGELAYELIKKRRICDMSKFHLIFHSTSFKLSNRKYNNHRRFVYVGRLEPGKGIEHLCEVFSKIEEEFTFDIVGGGRLYNSLNDKFGDKFRFHGYRNKDYVMEQFRKADFFVLPSFSEHCPVSVLEGMACGCIPILSNFGNISQMISDCSSGFVFDLSPHYEVYAQNMAEVIGCALEIGANRADEMIKKNYKLLHSYFSPEIMLKKTLEVFEKALRKH